MQENQPTEAHLVTREEMITTVAIIDLIITEDIITNDHTDYYDKNSINILYIF